MQLTFSFPPFINVGHMHATIAAVAVLQHWQKWQKRKKKEENPAWRLQQVHADTSSLWRPWQTICFDPPNEPNHHVL
jgi:hypothetical protein